MPGPELQGVNVLVTRPQAQTAWLSNEIRQRAGKPIALPLLEIYPLPVTHAMQQVLSQLNHANMLIFVSANAVEHGLRHLLPLPATLQVGAIGEATAERLRIVGVQVDLVPARFDSEGFLAMPQMQDLHGKIVIIVRGAGGREKLADSLRTRGAQVLYLEVYQRACPHWDVADVQAALRADVITVTSSEALDNLAALARLPDAESLWTKPLVVFHQRIAGRAHELGFTLKPVVTEYPGDGALLAALLWWANEQKGMEHA